MRRYYNTGNVNDFEIVDGKKVLKDGHRMTVRMQAMDANSLSDRDEKRHRDQELQRCHDNYDRALTTAWKGDACSNPPDDDDDDNGDEETGRRRKKRSASEEDSASRLITTDGRTGLHRPGYRYLQGLDGNKQQIADCHEAYLRDLENAWRHPTINDLGGPAGAGKQGWKQGPDEDDPDQSEWGAGELARDPSDDDESEYAPGELKRKRNKKRRAVESEDVAICQFVDHRANRPLVRPPAGTMVDVDTLQKERERVTDALYAAEDERLANSWRGGNQ